MGIRSPPQGDGDGSSLPEQQGEWENDYTLVSKCALGLSAERLTEMLVILWFDCVSPG